MATKTHETSGSIEHQKAHAESAKRQADAVKAAKEAAEAQEKAQAEQLSDDN